MTIEERRQMEMGSSQTASIGPLALMDWRTSKLRKARSWGKRDFKRDGPEGLRDKRRGGGKKKKKLTVAAERAILMLKKLNPDAATNHTVEAHAKAA